MNETTSGKDLVCPRCGVQTTRDAVWCGSCGLNLRQVGTLPSADAYSAGIREKEWLAARQPQGGSDESTVGQQPASKHRKGLVVGLALGAVIVLAGTGVGISVLRDDSDSDTKSQASTQQQSSATTDDEGSGDAPLSVDRAGSLEEAEATVEAEGFDVIDSSDYDPDSTLRVLLGNTSGNNDGHSQKAFFFVGDRFIGTDTAEPSLEIDVDWQDDTTVALSYGLYGEDDAFCCPSRYKVVRFHWTGSELEPLDEIPTNDFDATQHR